MHSTSRPLQWDIFCNVIDNYGDIGVCWRLARQLAAEHGFAIRLWVDELAAFKRICPEIDTQRPVQEVSGVVVRRWEGDLSDIVPGDVVIEAFACRLPEAFERAMAERSPQPVWINLEYLSAEAWVSDCHALPSPHPQLTLNKYFFFPGFDATTGGLLRENDLEARRQSFLASAQKKHEFWQQLGMLPPPDGALTISLFAYENPALPDLLTLWAQGQMPVCCLAPLTQTLPIIEAFADQGLQAGDVVCLGNLEIRMLPFVAQADYDALLWSCDINFVRGEDSFVRAQWAEKPMLWQIYPQNDDAHRDKLEAFLEKYCTSLSHSAASSVRALFLAWNGLNASGGIDPDSWQQWMDALPEIRQNAVNWSNRLKKQEDLCSSLVRFCLSKL
ncbi:MAG: elongation factor P maturation arginine rhamnosyltransferase EarP [Betaproteobacteria bacterium]